jgi:hypothetical protein
MRLVTHAALEGNLTQHSGADGTRTRRGRWLINKLLIRKARKSPRDP